MPALIEAKKIRKKFGSLTAVDGIDFEIRSGECLGFLGPNGAGKTTTVSLVTGLLTPDEGEVLFQGAPFLGDNHPAKMKIGLVPQELALFEELTAFQNLNFFGGLYSLQGKSLEVAIQSSLEFVGLKGREKEKVKNYSGGMKRRLNMAVALLHDPEILILDEPTVGVDPQSRNSIFENLEELKKRGKTILYTTHYMEEAERLCDRIIVVDHGRVVADDTLRGLYRRLPAANRLILEVDGISGEVIDRLRKISGVQDVRTKSGELQVGVADLSRDAASVLGFLASEKIAYQHLVSERPNLETVFLHLTGRKLRDE